MFERENFNNVSIISLKLQEYHSYRSLIPWKKITRQSMLEYTLDCDVNSNTNARTQVQRDGRKDA